MLKRLSPLTALLRTPFTRTIKFHRIIVCYSLVQTISNNNNGRKWFEPRPYIPRWNLSLARHFLCFFLTLASRISRSKENKHCVLLLYLQLPTKLDIVGVSPKNNFLGTQTLISRTVSEISNFRATLTLCNFICVVCYMLFFSFKGIKA